MLRVWAGQHVDFPNQQIYSLCSPPSHLKVSLWRDTSSLQILAGIFKTLKIWKHFKSAHKPLYFQLKTPATMMFYSRFSL